ncbi:hypothetical protein [Sphingosinicella terrae]|uniref:hypothetical protein n=1 Tax=Sphingosinicella terrae TaxID=2172047 RepID=UPI0013B43161|nr:hypothetical protein [Sphingosinicella terrae]
MTWIGAVLAVAGVALLRLAWARPRRSRALNGLGWSALATATILAWQGDGAWGVALASLFAMAAALVLLAVAGAKSPAGRAKPSDRKTGMLPEAGEPKRIGGRVLTFLVVVLGGLVVSIGLAIAVRGVGGLLGWQEADGNALAFFTVPLAWAVLASVLLMQARRRSQIVTLAVCSAPAFLFLLTGVGT